MIGKLLCWLGVHDHQVGGWNWVAEYDTMPRSVWGACVRPGCDSTWQFDN